MYVKKENVKDVLISRLSEMVATLNEHALFIDGHPIHILGQDCIIHGPSISSKEYRDLVKGARVWDVVWDGEVLVNLYEHMLGHTGNFVFRWNMIHPSDRCEESLFFTSKMALSFRANYKKDWKTGHAHLVTILNYFVCRASLLRVDKELDNSRYSLCVNSQLPENPVTHQRIPVVKFNLKDNLPSFITKEFNGYEWHRKEDHVTGPLQTFQDDTGTKVFLSSRKDTSLQFLLWEGISLFDSAYEALYAWCKKNARLALSVYFKGQETPSLLFLEKEEVFYFKEGFFFYKDALSKKMTGINMSNVISFTKWWGHPQWQEHELPEILDKCK